MEVRGAKEKKASFWGASIHPDIGFVYVDSLPDAPTPQLSLGWKLVYFERGTKSFRCGGATHLAAASDLICIAPGQVHMAVHEQNDAALRVLHLPEILLTQERLKGQELRRMTLTAPLFIRNVEVIRHFRALHQPSSAFSSRLEQQTHFTYLLESLRASLPAPSAGSENTAVKRAKQWIEAHYAEDLALTDLARITGLHPAYLCRVFSEATGVPPHAYLIAVRVARAASLLRRGVSVGDTAQETGFYDQAHLNRHFRRIMQTTPTDYIHQMAAGQTYRDIPQQNRQRG